MHDSLNFVCCTYEKRLIKCVTEQLMAAMMKKIFVKEKNMERREKGSNFKPMWRNKIII